MTRARTRHNRRERDAAATIGGAAVGNAPDTQALALANAMIAAACARGAQQPDPALALATSLGGRTEPGSLAGLTPAVLAQQLLEFHAGNYNNVARVWEVMERRDDACVTAAGKIHGKVLRRMRDWTVEAADDSAAARRQAEWLRGFYNRLTAQSAVNDVIRGGVRKAAGFALDAYSKQYSFLAKAWTGRGADIALTLKAVPLWFFGRREGRWLFDPLGSGVPTASLDRRQWVVAAQDFARMEAASVLVLFKRLPTHQLVHILEKWGVPSVYGSSPGAKGTDAWNAVFEAVQNIRAGFAAVIGTGATLNTIEPKTAAANSMHRPWISDCSEAITRIYLGGSLSTMAEAGTGTLAGGAQADDTDEIVDDVVDWVVETFQEQVDADALLYGLGADVPMAWFNVPGRRGREGAERMTIYRDAAALGARVPLAQLHDEFDLERAADDDPDVLVPPAPAQAAGMLPPAAGGTRPPGPPERGIRRAAGAGNADAGAPVAAPVPESWSAPVAEWFAALDAAVQAPGTDDAGAVQVVRKALAELPQLAEAMDIEALADTLAAGMIDAAGKAVEEGKANAGRDASLPAPIPTHVVGSGAAKRVPEQPRRQAGDCERGARTSLPGGGAGAAPLHLGVGNAPGAIDFGANQAAVGKLVARLPVTSPLRTAEWAAVPVALRERALFSAGVTSARMLAEIRRRLEAALAQTVDGTFMNRDRFVRELRDVAVAEGLSEGGEGYGALTDIGSVRRLELVYDVQTQQAAGYAQWRGGVDPDVADAFPAQELLRVEARQNERDWQARWSEAGGAFVEGGRMVALKTDPIWERISRFGTPWPPFDFGSGMGVEDVERAEAERLGLLAPDERLPDAAEGFNARVESDLSSVGDELLGWLGRVFGERVAIDGGVARWREAAGGGEGAA